MKIAVSASSPDLSSPVDPRFGRCSYFIFIDPETMKFEAVENPNISAPGGAGIQSAQFVVDKGAKVVLTGSCGPNAFQTLQAAQVEVIVGVAGSVEDAVRQYKSGQFQPISQPNAPAHSGMGMGPGFGLGRGMGRGMGGGFGRGMGTGRGYGYVPPSPGSPFPSPPQSASSPEEEIKYLKQQAEYLRQQMENITKKIEELEKNKK
ncbi:MAG: hypothetical protein B5M54_07570 [Candidatus Aminicenantes bacterium 4484_214]|nr:MAG: hypothetical protein B5M54_07570 [Candidatus Aminicenantes bacterium 4484_214]RLE09650.1 MAG: dinitrogenase iron-molybdenum cofactor biosynthesis protein [Candidatus Aminicenantes bacterium]